MQISLKQSSSTQFIAPQEGESLPIGRLSVWLQEAIARLVKTGQQLKTSSLQSRVLWDKSYQDTSAWQIFSERVLGTVHLASIASAKYEWVSSVSAATGKWIESSGKSFSLQGEIFKEKMQRVSSILSGEENFMKDLLSLLQQVIQAEKLSS